MLGQPTARYDDFPAYKDDRHSRSHSLYSLPSTSEEKRAEAKSLELEIHKKSK